MSTENLDTRMGPKMRALPRDTWRMFVLLYTSHGCRDAKAAYKQAFDREGRSEAATQVNASKLLHDQRIQEAVQEVCRAQLQTLLPRAVDVLQRVVNNPSHSENVKVALEIANRTGLHSVTEHRTTTTLGDDKDAIARIGRMAMTLGIPLEQLLGRRLAEQAPIIDITPEPVLAEPLAIEYQEPEEW